MSRTYRRGMVPLDCSCGAPVGWHWRWLVWGEFPSPADQAKEIAKAQREGEPPDRCCYCWTNQKYDFYTKRNRKRDRKPWGKSPKWYKQMREQARRAKVREAMANYRYDNIPRFRHDNDWNWS